MKILCLLDIDDYDQRNTFPIDFVDALRKNSEVTSIDYGIHWLSKEIPEWNIVHIHWPGDLLKGKILNRQAIRELELKLQQWRRYTTIITTIHDHIGYYRNSSLFDSLYNCVFTNSDGLVHMGRGSVKLFMEKAPELFNKVPFTIIPHGNYRSIGAAIEKNQARKNLSLEKDWKIILVIGKLRHKEELDIMVQPFKLMHNENAHLIFLGTFQSSRSFFKNLDIFRFIYSVFQKLSWRLKLYTCKRIHAKIGFASSDSLSAYLSAADIVFVPRKRVLNSGNVPLGFTFGKIVVGPNWGNPGDILTKYENPSFNPDASHEEIAQALVQGLALSQSNLAARNQQVADKEWDWVYLGEMHVEFYRKLLNQKKD